MLNSLYSKSPIYKLQVMNFQRCECSSLVNKNYLKGAKVSTTWNITVNSEFVCSSGTRQ